VSGATDVLILINWAPTSHRSIRAQMREELDALTADYSRLLEPHVALHGELFDRVRFELDETTIAPDATNEALLSDA